MTIKELETLTGLDRATIRFYEKAGLLAPQRLSNGYRDYSQEDALTLEKIALLRRLDLPLEDIRAVQGGEVPLTMALQRQHEALMERQHETAQALQISLAIQKEQASYNTLQPQKYKGQLPPPVREHRLPQPESAVAEQAAGHPWMRYFARHLDLTIYGLFSAALLMFLLRISPQSGAFDLLNTVLGIGIHIGLEPLLLSTWGYTPGKWIMGLRLRDSKGGKLDYTDGLCRTVSLIYHGMGLCIPIVNLWCYWKSYRRAVPAEATPPIPPQDQPWDDLTEYTVEERRWHQYLVWVLAEAAAFGLLAGLVLLAAQPNLLGRELTRERYVKNVNHVLDFSVEKNEFTLNANGSWNTTGLLAFVTKTDTDDFQQYITEQDGLVTAVSMTYHIHDGESPSVIGDGEIYKNATVFALLEKAPNKKQTEQLTALYEMGEGRLELGDWVVTQTIGDKPYSFTDLYKWSKGMWYWTGGEETSPAQIPSIHFQIKHK